MRLSAPYKEFSVLELCIYGVPIYEIEHLIKTGDYEVVVKINRKGKSGLIPETEYQKERIKDFEQWANSKRHTVVLENKILKMKQIKLKFYSQRLNSEAVKSLGLEPIEKAANAERIQEMLTKLNYSEIKI